MGNSESDLSNSKFNPSIYTARGVPLNEVLKIRRTFDSLKDDEDYDRVSVDKIQELYVDSYDRKFLDQNLAGKNYINFDEFFNLNTSIIRARKLQFPDMQVDGLEPNATCGCCFSITNKDAGMPEQSQQFQPQYQFFSQETERVLTINLMKFSTLLIILLFITLSQSKKKKKESLKTWPQPKQPDKVINTTICEKDDENCIEYQFPTLQVNLNENDKLSIKRKIKKLNKYITDELDDRAMGGHEYYVDLDEDQEMALFSKNDIKKGDIIFQLTSHQYLHSQSASPSFFKESDRIYWHMQIPKLKHVNPDDMLAISLLYHSVWVLDSKFSEWLYTLPVEIISPIITLSEDELELLGYNENPSIKRYIDQFRHNVSHSYYDVTERIQDQWMNVIELMFKEFMRRQTLSFSDYTWAKYMIHSRGTYFNNRDNVILVPLLDLIKYKEVKTLDNYKQQVDSQNLDSLITYYNGEFVLKADQDIPAGQKITHNYKLQGSQLKNYEFLLSYGYIPKINQNECVKIELAPMNSYFHIMSLDYKKIVQMEKPSEYRSILFDINLIGNICLNPWLDYPNRIFIHHMLNNMNNEQIQQFFREYKNKVLFHDSVKAKTFGLMKLLPPGINITFDFRVKAREQLAEYKSQAEEKLLQIEEFKRVKNNSTETQNIKMLKQYYQSQINLVKETKELIETIIDKNYEEYLKNQEQLNKEEL